MSTIKKLLPAVFIATALGLTACAPPPADNTMPGVYIGLGSGALTGAAIGTAVGGIGGAGIGVAIGAPAGALIGGAIGAISSMQKPLDDVHFRTASATLNSAGAHYLAPLAKTLVDNPRLVVYVSGYTDSVGGQHYNAHLSERRAQSAAIFLQKHGVAKYRIYSMAYGENDPVASNKTTQGRSENRRVELMLKTKSYY